MTGKLRGVCHCGLDASGRLSIPRKFLTVLSGKLVLTVDVKSSIALFNEEGFQGFINKHFDVLGGYDPSNEDHAMLATDLYSNTVDASIDNRGRITLSASLMAQAGITGRKVVIVGQGDHLGIVDANYWDNFTDINFYDQ